MIRSLALDSPQRSQHASTLVILIAAIVAPAGIGVAGDASSEEQLPLLPPSGADTRLAVYQNDDRLGLSDSGMIESVTSPPVTDATDVRVLPGPSDPLVSESFETGLSHVQPEIPLPLPDRVSDEALSINYETALAMIGGNHPVVGFAQSRVREAYADLMQARSLWLPTIRAGVSYHRHQGNLQASDGTIIDVSRGSLQAGLGAGAIGAGTTQRPGVVAEFETSDAIFRPRIAERTVWAQRHAASSAFQQQLRDVALAYNNLLLAYQEVQVIEESRRRTSELAELTKNYAEAGEGLQADADRMSTELNLVESRLLDANERQSVAQNRLIEALSLNCVTAIRPADIQLTPIHVVDASLSRGELTSIGLAHRPELKQLQCLVAATVEEYKRQKFAPFLPSVLMGVSQSGFGGGLGSDVDDVNPRTDLDLLAVWEVRNLGFGERAARSRASAATQLAKYRQLQQMDRVAREIADGQTRITHRAQQLIMLQSAIGTATDSHERNRSRIKDGEGLPLEVLQSVQALEQSQLAYARAVARHNDAQFQLQWALGWPINGLALR